MAKGSRLSLRRSMAWFVGPYSVAVLGYLLMYAAAARLLGREDLATFVVALTASALIGQVGLLGVHRSGLREAARLGDDDLEGLGQLRAGVMAVSFTALPVVSLFTAGVVYLLMLDHGQTVAFGIGMTTAALTYLSGQQRLVASCLRGLGHARVAGLLEGRSGGAAVAVGQALLVCLVWQLRPDWGLLGALAGAAGGFLVPMALAWIVLVRRWHGAPTPSGALRNLRTVVARDWKFAVSQVGGQANASLDLWVCSLLLPPASASLFAAGQRLSQLLLMPMTAMQVVFSPAIARLSVSDDLSRLQTLVRTGSTMGSIIVGLAWLPMVLAPAMLLEVVFGDAFRDSSPVLVLLATAYFANAVSGMSGVTLSMSHHEGYVARVQWIGLAMRLLLGVVAAINFGLLGIAVSSAMVTVVFYLLMWAQARTQVGIVTHATLRPDVRLLGKVAG